MARRRPALREEPRRRRRRSRPWQKAIALAIAVVTALAVMGVLRKTLRPVLLCWRERAGVHRFEARLAAAKRERQALLEKRRYLRSPEGAQTEARRLGFVRPGEVSVVMEDDKDPRASGPSSPPRE